MSGFTWVADLIQCVPVECLKETLRFRRVRAVESQGFHPLPGFVACEALVRKRLSSSGFTQGIDRLFASRKSGGTILAAKELTAVNSRRNASTVTLVSWKGSLIECSQDA